MARLKLEQQGRIARGPAKRIEPTGDDIKNGWTAESLSAYHAERERAQFARIDPASEARRVRPREANHRYRVHRWRG